jgi:hypothetical protein
MAQFDRLCAPHWQPQEPGASDWVARLQIVQRPHLNSERIECFSFQKLGPWFSIQYIYWVQARNSQTSQGRTSQSVLLGKNRNTRYVECHHIVHQVQCMEYLATSDWVNIWLEHLSVTGGGLTIWIHLQKISHPYLAFLFSWFLNRGNF